MAKYLWHGAYTTEGDKGVLRDGGTARVNAVRSTIEGLGGRLEAFYFAFGADDFFVIVDLADNVTVAAASLAVAATGAVSLDTVVLMTPEEVDKAVHMSVNYRAPGA